MSPPAPPPRGEGCADRLQLCLSVLQGHICGNFKPCSDDLEEAQHCQLDLPQQQGLLGGRALDMGPAGLLGDRVTETPPACIPRKGLRGRGVLAVCPSMPSCW